MTCYTCEPRWADMLCCIYEAWSGKKGFENIRLITEPVGQYSLFDEYVHVDYDERKAASVEDAICRKISPEVYGRLAYCSMAYEEDALDIIYRVLILAFAMGPDAVEMVQYRDVMRFRTVLKRVESEAHHFLEFLRFHSVAGGILTAHIEPKSRIVAALGSYFSDRMPSENWMIVDDVHREALVHPKDAEYYIRYLTEEELKELAETEKIRDGYNNLWQVFFDSIAIEQRINPKCQRTLFPLWMRRHADEFIQKK